MSSTIAAEISGSRIANVPPKPQHSRSRDSGASSTFASCARRLLGSSTIPISRSAWQEECHVTRTFSPRSVSFTFSTLRRNCVSSNTLAANASASFSSGSPSKSAG